MLIPANPGLSLSELAGSQRQGCTRGRTMSTKNGESRRREVGRCVIRNVLQGELDREFAVKTCKRMTVAKTFLALHTRQQCKHSQFCILCVSCRTSETESLYIRNIQRESGKEWERHSKGNVSKPCLSVHLSVCLSVYKVLGRKKSQIIPHITNSPHTGKKALSEN